MLANGETLPPKYKNHPLKGAKNGLYDCHILPDLVLIYQIQKHELILYLLELDSHSNIFK